MNDKQHAGETVGDQQGASGIAEGRFASIARFDKLQRAGICAGLHLVIEDGIFPIVGFAVLSNHGLRYAFCADDVSGLLEVFFDEFAGADESVHRGWLGSR
jgi:hypothetical protein